mgnify:CR=1 FL=1
MDRINIVKKTINIVNYFFEENNITYWLEAGTALGAHRDGKIFDWDHDIDLAIWKKDLPDIDLFYSYFENNGFKVVVQKGFPFIDNIIQLKVKNDYKDDLIDIDLYLYSVKGSNAYMRWLHKPEDNFKYFKKIILYTLKSILIPPNAKWEKRSKIFPKPLVIMLFKLIIFLHVYSSKCIFHIFPKSFFLDLKKIKFYGHEINIPNQINDFLAYRYGENWETPDLNYNSSGKWKKSSARKIFKMNLLPLPTIIEKLIK